MMVCVHWAMRLGAAEDGEATLRVALYVDAANPQATPILAKDGLESLVNREAAPPSRLLLTLFAGGRCFVPIESTTFPISTTPPTHQLTNSSLLAAVQQSRIPLYGVLDCLHWTLPGTPPEADLFQAHPDWQELNASYSCNAAADGKYASPFHPEVRAALVQLMEEIAQALPDLDGIVLDCRLSLQEYLTYSEATRVAFIRAHQMDPMDISLAPHDEAGYQALHTLHRWRLDEVTKLVGELSAAFRLHNPEGKVVGRGFANLYRWRGGGQNWLAQDWLNWAIEGHVDELLLECDWAAPENAESFALAADLVQKAGVPVSVTPLLYAPSRPGGASYEAQLAALQKQAWIERVVLEVATAEDWKAAQAFLAQKHEIVEPPPPTTEVALGDDRRLQQPISLAEPGTPLPEVLAKLSTALGVPLRASGAVREKTVSLALPAQPAAAILKQLAGAVQGVWRAAGPGYVLGELSDPDRQQGDQLRASGQYKEAIAAYEQALGRGANEVEAHLGIAQCYWNLGDYQSAVDHYEEVLQRDPDHPEAYIGLGSSYRALGEYEQAIANFQELLKRRPDSVWGRVEMGLAQAALAQTEAAVRTLQEAIKTAPEMWQPRYYLAQTHFQAGDFADCQKVLHEALQLPLDEAARKQVQELLEQAEALRKEQQAGSSKQ